MPPPPDSEVNPYAPPASEVGVQSATKSKWADVSEPAPLPMLLPTSTKWARFLMLLPISVVFWINWEIIRNNGWLGVVPYYTERPALLVRSLICIVGCIAFVVFGRSPWAYLIGILGLGLGVCVCCFSVWQDWVRQRPSFLTAEDQGSLIAGIAMPSLLIYLLYRFTFGRPSRIYYRISQAAGEEEKVGRPS